MKTRIMAFMALVVIALAWHFFLVRNRSLAPTAQVQDPDLTVERVPSNTESQKAPNAPNPSGAQLLRATQETNAQLAHFRDCLQTQNCDFPKTDPRSYELAVGQAAARELSQLAQLVRAHRWESEQISQLGLGAFQWQDDHVRTQALALLATQSPAPANMLGVMAGLRASHDSSIYKMALQELKRYAGSSERSLVENFLADTIQNGSFFAASAVAGDLLPFLSDNNVTRFREILAQMDPATLRYRALEQSLKEFERR